MHPNGFFSLKNPLNQNLKVSIPKYNFGDVLGKKKKESVIEMR